MADGHGRPPSDDGTVVRAFLAAIRFAESVVSSPSVEDAWEDASALERMTVGDVAGHLFLVIRRVDLRLDDTVDASLPLIVDFPAYARIDEPEDLDRELHRQVRADGRRIAERGWAGLCDEFGARVERLHGRLRNGRPAVVSMGDGVLAFDTYLTSRVVEVLVHADDILVSTDLSLDLPGEAVEVANRYVVDVARRIHGDRAFLQVFTRRERASPGVPSIF